MEIRCNRFETQRQIFSITFGWYLGYYFLISSEVKYIYLTSFKFYFFSPQSNICDTFHQIFILYIDV